MKSLEKALEELRLWSSPGRRAELVAAAWRYGETNISTLAEAARVTRQTIYTDLDSAGIDASDERRETREPAWLEPFEPGLTATADTEQAAWDLLIGFVNRAAEGAGREPLPAGYLPSPSSTDNLDAFLITGIRQWSYARYHRAVLPAARAEHECRRRATRAIHLAETKWEALRTAKHWTAAHHQWIEAVDTARREIAVWTTAADAYEALSIDRELETMRKDGEDALPERRLLPSADAVTPKITATEFEETFAARRDLARLTLSAAEDG